MSPSPSTQPASSNSSNTINKVHTGEHRTRHCKGSPRYVGSLDGAGEVSALLIGSNSSGKLLLLLLTSRLVKGAPAAGSTPAGLAAAAGVALKALAALDAASTAAALAPGVGALPAAVAADAFPAVLSTTHFILLGA